MGDSDELVQSVPFPSTREREFRQMLQNENPQLGYPQLTEDEMTHYYQGD